MHILIKMKISSRGTHSNKIASVAKISPDRRPFTHNMAGKATNKPLI